MGQRQQQALALRHINNILHHLLQRCRGWSTQFIGLAIGHAPVDQARNSFGNIANKTGFYLGLRTHHRETGAMRAMLAMRLKKRSSGPNTTEGRTIEAPGNALEVAASALPLAWPALLVASKVAPMPETMTISLAFACLAAFATASEPKTMTASKDCAPDETSVPQGVDHGMCAFTSGGHGVRIAQVGLHQRNLPRRTQWQHMTCEVWPAAGHTDTIAPFLARLRTICRPMKPEPPKMVTSWSEGLKPRHPHIEKGVRFGRPFSDLPVQCKANTCCQSLG